MSGTKNTVGLEGTYPTQDEAFKAVERLKASHGVWPGVICHGDGSASLEHTPESYEGRRDTPAVVRLKAPAETRAAMWRRAIEAGRSPKGGWTKAKLAEWGVPWPPPAGWKEALIAGKKDWSTDPASPGHIPAGGS